jgi:hypothetical protein
VVLVLLIVHALRIFIFSRKTLSQGYPGLRLSGQSLRPIKNKMQDSCKYFVNKWLDGYMVEWIITIQPFNHPTSKTCLICEEKPQIREVERLER